MTKTANQVVELIENSGRTSEIKYWTRLSISIHVKLSRFIHESDSNILLGNFAKVDLLGKNKPWDQTPCNYSLPDVAYIRVVKFNPLSHMFPRRSTLCQRKYKPGVKTLSWLLLFTKYFSTLFLFFLKVFYFKHTHNQNSYPDTKWVILWKTKFLTTNFPKLTVHFQRKVFIFIASICFQLIWEKQAILS